MRPDPFNYPYFRLGDDEFGVSSYIISSAMYAPPEKHERYQGLDETQCISAWCHFHVFT